MEAEIIDDIQPSDTSIMRTLSRSQFNMMHIRARKEALTQRDAEHAIKFEIQRRLRTGALTTLSVSEKWILLPQSEI